ncbi:3'-5' exoribonuclease [Lachnotalea glycerini]|uniref:3'-5' exoribonuclease n=1 Tax=Lachnotalea glycerini TaxID=1763509 RepID=A0A255I9H9_9FIRM|nr:HD domain-containing protein [Lachnotalea glycerini]PXV91139.1 3'-5' exoribonuclease [Lachnotalea glycerini]RDY28621.1 HD domain-containing protein [Lachnotalea glycerini]
MKYIETLHEGDRISDIYLCKFRQAATTKNGKPYDNLIIQDKTGVLDAKIWDPNSSGIDEFDILDYIEVFGDVTSFQGALQVNIKRIRKAGEGEYNPSDYFPVSSKNIDVMYQEIMVYVNNIKNTYLSQLTKSFFEDNSFEKKFKAHSAAKSVHHGFIGGLLEHTLGVVNLCNYYANAYPVLNRDLLITAALFHDVGKLKEISEFPSNDYTDDGQLLGHIIIGVEILGERIRCIEGFPACLALELKHCIIAHHGELAYGSPKKPALAEALALNLADNTDAKIQTITELFNAAGDNQDWLGYNRLFESNMRKTSI